MDSNVTALAGAPEAEALVVTAVIVTRDRPKLLRRCLEAVFRQTRVPDRVLVVDNASGAETRNVLLSFPMVEIVRLDNNVGGAGGFCVGMQAAIASGASFMWLMDDDGWPRDATCLQQLVLAAVRLDIVAPLVLDEDDPQRLAFAIRVRGRTLFTARAVQAYGVVGGFAHLFNGALVRRELVEQIGLPDPRFFVRGDEVEFFYRACRVNARIALLTAVAFMHPGSSAEVHPILGGLYYAVVPNSPAKQYLQFRNRGFIFRSYRMWVFMAADIVRYGWYYLITSRGDLSGLRRWYSATWAGMQGWFGPPPRVWRGRIKQEVVAIPGSRLAAAEERIKVNS